jgi:hypothetical protein
MNQAGHSPARKQAVKRSMYRDLSAATKDSSLASGIKV